MEKFIPLSVPNFKGNELRYVTEAVESEWVSTAGGFITDFEKKISDYLHSPYAVACQNGTAGLHTALMALGVKRGDEVIVPTLTFISPVNTIRYAGAEPVFMDCDDTLNMDMNKLEDFLRNECLLTSEGLKNKKTSQIIRAVMPVHIFGNPADMESLMDLAVQYQLKVIEDATESLGTYFTKGRYQGRFTGTIGDIGVFSFNGNKIITTGGGGMMITNDPVFAKRAKYLTTQAKDDEVRFIHNEVGYNYRMTNIEAALGIAQLEQLEKFIEIKIGNFQIYKKELSGMPGLQLMDFRKDARSNHWFYSLLVEKSQFGMDREELMKHLTDSKIQTRPVWYLNHLQKPYLSNQNYRIERAHYYWERILNLPCSTSLSSDEVLWVVDCIKKGRGRA